MEKDNTLFIMHCKRALARFCDLKGIEFNEILESLNRRIGVSPPLTFDTYVRFFDRAITWSETEEGWDYWFEIQVEWATSIIYVASFAARNGDLSCDDFLRSRKYVEKLFDYKGRCYNDEHEKIKVCEVFLTSI